MRISDWSSDVCSSDLTDEGADRASRTGADGLPRTPQRAPPARTARHHRARPAGPLRRLPQARPHRAAGDRMRSRQARPRRIAGRALSAARSEEHTSELQSLMRISYAALRLKTKTNTYKQNIRQYNIH